MGGKVFHGVFAFAVGEVQYMATQFVVLFPSFFSSKILNGLEFSGKQQSSKTCEAKKLFCSVLSKTCVMCAFISQKIMVVFRFYRDRNACKFVKNVLVANNKRRTPFPRVGGCTDGSWVFCLWVQNHNLSICYNWSNVCGRCYSPEQAWHQGRLSVSPNEACGHGRSRLVFNWWVSSEAALLSCPEWRDECCVFCHGLKEVCELLTQHQDGVLTSAIVARLRIRKQNVLPQKGELFQERMRAY